MGETDTRTVDDGRPEDILIIEKRVHPQFNGQLYIDDVAVLYLQRHVTFTGIHINHIKFPKSALIAILIV